MRGTSYRLFLLGLRDPIARLGPGSGRAARGAARASLLGLLLAAGPAFPHAPLDEQIADLDARIDRRPADASLYLKRGDLHRRRGEHRAAGADYRRARRIDPALEAVDLRLGGLYLDAGEPRRARACLDRYLARRPRDPDGLRARALRALGMPLAAAEDLGLAIAAFLPPRRPEPDLYLERARAFEAAGAGHLDAAIEVLDEGMRTLGPIVSLQIPAIDLDLRAGRFEAALRRVDALVEIPGLRDAWMGKRREILERAAHHRIDPLPDGIGGNP